MKAWRKCRKPSAANVFGKGKRSIAKKFYNKRETLCEDVLEILHYDSNFRVWFDRGIALKLVATHAQT